MTAPTWPIGACRGPAGFSASLVERMIGFLVRRVIQAVIVIIAVMLLVFLLAHVIPGGAARAVLGTKATTAKIHQFNVLNGFNLPWWDQFYQYFLRIIWHHNLGYSYSYNQTVTALISDKLPKTLVLVGFSTIIALVISIPLGILQVVRRNKPSDYVLTGLSFIFYAMPAFLLGTLLILFFAIDVKWFPVGFNQSQSVSNILTDPRGLVLPELTLAALTIASFSRYMRSSMMEAMTEDYIRTARAKGAAPRRVLYVHALRNALIPILTLLGLSIPAIVSGALITESVFNYPGMGFLTTEAAFKTDIPVLLGTTLIATIATVAGSSWPTSSMPWPTRGSAMPGDGVLPGGHRTRRWPGCRCRGQVATAERWRSLPVADSLPPDPRAARNARARGPAPGGPCLRREQAGRHRPGHHHHHGAVLLRRTARVPHQPDRTPRQALVSRPSQHVPPSAQATSSGTDNSGFDILGRLMFGGKNSLIVGFVAALAATIFGVVYGAVSGFVGGWVDALMMRFIDVLLSIPQLFLLIVLAVIFHPSLHILILVIAVVAWLVPGRLIRGETLTLRVREYVQAVRVMGGSRSRIIFRHIIPNTVGTIVVNATFQVADAILLLAALGFLGLGLPAPQTDWGAMLSNGVEYATGGYWWLIYPAGFCIVIVVVAFNFVGDALRDSLEVRLQTGGGGLTGDPPAGVLGGTTGGWPLPRGRRCPRRGLEREVTGGHVPRSKGP